MPVDRVRIRAVVVHPPCTSHDASAVSGVQTLLSHFLDLHRSSAGWPLASPERVARRGSQWPGAAHRSSLPSWQSRPLRTGRAKGSRATERPLRREHLGGTCASVPGHDGRLVGSLRLERQYRGREGIVAVPFAQGREGNAMHMLEYFAGIDWGLGDPPGLRCRQRWRGVGRAGLQSRRSRSRRDGGLDPRQGGASTRTRSGSPSRSRTDPSSRP